MPLPPGVSRSDFNAALTAFERVVGKEWVFTSDEDLNLYRDAYSAFRDQPEEPLASAAVAPDGVAQVQEIVRIANRYRIPIYPISTGRNLGYGGCAPILSGSVVVDLKRMNRILEVDEKNHSVLVEPGVSYFDLYRHLQDTGSNLWIDCPDPGWGGVLGNAIDRGGGYTMAQYRNHFDAHCGMEIVLPDGDLLRTGMGAVTNSKTWQQYKTGAGPWVDGIFSQGNYGICTKMGFWMMPRPEAYMYAKVNVTRYQDFQALVETLNYLESLRIVTGFPDFGSPLLGTVPTGRLPLALEGKEYTELFADKTLAGLRAGTKLGFSNEIERYGVEKGIPYWELYVSFYGPPEVIDAHWAATKRHFGKIRGATFQVVHQTALPIDPNTATEYREPELGIPSLRLFSYGARSQFVREPATGHFWFTPIIPRDFDSVIEANRVFGEAAERLGMPLFRSFSLPACFWERAFIFILPMTVTGDAALDRKHVEGFRELIRIGGEKGWGEYRTAPIFQPEVMGVYNFNNRALTRFHQRLKDAIDPNGIISAGRYDIWPKHMPEKRI